MFALFFLAIGCRSNPDVILLTVDTLRYDHVSILDVKSPALTKHIDTLAQDSVRYTNAYSPISVTGPAFTSMLTGQSIESHGVSMNVFRGGNILEEDEITITERFKEKEYQTGAFISGFTLRPVLGLTQGFDKYDANLKEKNRRWGNHTAKLAVRWLKNAEEQIFLWYHSYDPHGPWHRWGKRCKKDISKKIDSNKIPIYQRIDNCSDPKEYKNRYAKAVEFADKNIGTITKALKTQDRYNGAMIVFTADHGESFTERELWFDHGTTAHEEQLHVPLIIKYPKNRDAKKNDSRLVSLMDIAPTLAEEAGLKALPKATGRSLLDKNYKGADYLIGESSHCKDEKVLSCTPKGPTGKEYSYRTNTESLMLKGTVWEKYDRQKDRPEMTPLSMNAAEYKKAGELFLLKKENASKITWPPETKNQKDAETQMLQSLGYMGKDEE